MLLVQGCYEGGEEDYCEFTSDYPSVAEIRRRVRTRTSSLDKSLLFTPLEAEQREEVREKFSREAGGGGGGGGGERSKLNLHSDAFNYVEESAVCGSQETYIYPRTARNTRRQWRFVVNILGDEGGQQQQQGEDYVQAVKIEKCLRAGEACNLDNSGLQQTVCRSQAFMLTTPVENIFYSDKNIPTPN